MDANQSRKPYRRFAKKPAANPEPYVTLEEAAEQIGVSRTSLLEALREGLVPGTDVDAFWLLKVSDAKKFFETTQKQETRSRVKKRLTADTDSFCTAGVS